MGRHWGIPPLRIGIHGTKLVNQLWRNESGCDILVPWWEGGEVRRAGSMPERCAVGVGLLPERCAVGVGLLPERCAGGVGLMPEC